MIYGRVPSGARGEPLDTVDYDGNEDATVWTGAQIEPARNVLVKDEEKRIKTKEEEKLKRDSITGELLAELLVPEASEGQQRQPIR